MDAARLFLVLTVAGAIGSPSRTMAQSPAQPVQHTANFAGQSGWSGTSTATPATTGYDRYGQPITSSAATITDRASSAFTETGTALRDGVEAGIRAANQQISSSNPFAASTAAPTTNTGSPSGVSAPPWTTTPSAASAPPSWASNPASSGATTGRSSSAGIMAMDGGWTSIGTSVAAPPLLIPQLPTTTTNFGNAGAAANRNGPNYPATASNDQQPLHSVLAAPAEPSVPATKPADDWANGWSNNTGGQPATIGRTGNQPSLGSTVRQSDLVPLQSNTVTTQDPRNSAGRTGAGWAETDSWTLPAQPTLGPAPVTIGSATDNRQVLTTGAATAPFGNQPAAQVPIGPTLGNINTVGTSPNTNPLAGGANQNVRNPTGVNTTTEQPWMPMVAAVLTLAGSLAANLFLGMSYLDARQKYQSLVRKTADTFRRVKAAA